MFTNNSTSGELFTYAVGRPYHPSVRFWPETGQYNYRQGAHELVLFYERPRNDEIKQIRGGRAEFRFYIENGVLVFLYAFGTPITWNDAPYTWHMVPKSQQTIPPVLLPEQKPLLNIFLVDASNGIVKALRLVTLDHSFGQALHNAICTQANDPFSQSAYDRNLSSIYARYSSDQLARMAQAKCVIKGKY